MGLEEKAVFEKIFPRSAATEREQIAYLVNQAQEEYLPEHGGTLYEHVCEGLAQLSKKYKLLVVSNCQENTVRDFLTWAQLSSYVLDYETHGRTRQSKAENIKAVVQRNQLQKPVYVGDTRSDEQAARMAGVPFIFVSYGFGTAEKPDFTFATFQELVDAFTAN